jgi:phospholipid/cholesterol/gamma-HCH transport system substrate-binding protein
MNKAAPSPARILAMVVFAFSCFGLLLFLWLSFGGAIPLKPKGYRFDVAFKGATQLAVEADVRAAGVSIGKVRKKRVSEDGNRTVATIEIERRYAPIREDARAMLRQKTLLGETFVELTMGSEDADAIPEGGRLVNERVRPNVELDEILDALDPYTRQAWRHWLQHTGAAVENSGRNLNDTFANLPGFVESGGDLLEILDQQRTALGTLVRETATVFGALTEREDQLQRLITSQDDVFTAIANERESWAETFRIFPTFLDESKATFSRLEDFSIKARPVVEDLEPAMRDLRPTLRDLGDFAPDLRRFFVNFDPLITISQRSMPATREVLNGLRPVLNELAPFLGQFNPILQYIGAHVYTLSDMFANLGVATAAKVKQPNPGGTGHYLRQFAPQGAEAVAIQPTRTSTNRGNTYWNPLGIIQRPASPKWKVPPSWDCNHIGGEKEPGGTPTQTPGCHVQGTFVFRGERTERFPHLTAEAYFAGQDRGARKTEGKGGNSYRLDENE